MVLKLEVGVSDLDINLQETWEVNKLQSFEDCHGEEFNFLTFYQKFKVDHGQFEREDNFPFDQLWQYIDNELKDDRYVIICLENKHRLNNADSCGSHMFVIYNKENDYLSFSKYYSETIYCNDVKKIVMQMGGTDILVYRKK